MSNILDARDELASARDLLNVIELATRRRKGDPYDADMAGINAVCFAMQERLDAADRLLKPDTVKGDC